jgi:hypothetical protein
MDQTGRINTDEVIATESADVPRPSRISEEYATVEL